MENVTTWKTRITKQGLSSYILIPKKMLDFEGIDDNDVIQVTVKKVMLNENDG